MLPVTAQNERHDTEGLHSVNHLWVIGSAYLSTAKVEPMGREAISIGARPAIPGARTAVTSRRRPEKALNGRAALREVPARPALPHARLL